MVQIDILQNDGTAISTFESQMPARTNRLFARDLQDYSPSCPSQSPEITFNRVKRSSTRYPPLVSAISRIAPSLLLLHGSVQWPGIAGQSAPR